jgi:hypothetical protein
MIFVTAIVGYLCYLYWIFFVRKRSPGVAVFVLIAQLFVIMDSLSYVKTTYHIDSLVDVAIEIMVNTVTPIGPSAYFYKNAMYSAAKIADYMQLAESRTVNIMIWWFFQVGQFLLFRASLGAFYIHSLRFRTDLQSVGYGGIVYAIDFFGPFRTAYRIVFKYENANPRRIMYAIVGIMLLWYEFTGAYGIFYMRLWASMIDMVFFRSIYGRTMHMLEFNVSFDGAAFPQNNALPWVSLKELNDIAANTGKLFATKAGRTVSGMGVVLRCNGKRMLYTVKHVVEGCSQITFLGQTVSSPEFRSLTNDDDPMMAMRFDCSNSAAEAPILLRSEVDRVQNLVFINGADGENGEVGERVVTMVHSFSLTRGKLLASVNLKKGDSGGPCFAVLNDGELRFCGVVSKGNSRRGAVNIISFCYGDEEADDSSTEGLASPAVRQFNSVRRIGFASDGKHAQRFKAALSLNKHVESHRRFYEAGIEPSEFRPTWDELDDSDAATASALAAHDAVVRREAELKRKNEDESEREDDDGDEYDGDQGGDAGPRGPARRNKNQDRKRRQKDRAAKKRQMQTAFARCEALKFQLLHVYSEPDARNIYTSITASGTIPGLKKRCFIQNSDGGRGYIVEEGVLPSEDWT